jgi:sulfite reductase beta subunit-like hemoprotein
MTEKTYSPAGETAPLGVIPIIDEEYDDFETEASKFRSGEIEEKAFMGYRLKRGVYGQRQADVQMVRVKIPFGGLRADQLDALGRVARDYAPLGKGHVTTRENVQFHFIPLEESIEILRLLGKVGLTTREACGNSVRNVTGSPYAGVSKEELFDPTPYAGALTLLRMPVPSPAILFASHSRRTCRENSRWPFPAASRTMSSQAFMTSDSSPSFAKWTGNR